jgi:general secretion pathway protein J
MSRNRGFTLVELLIALAIFALISAFAYRGLTGLLESREALSAESRKWRDVALFVGRFERDLQAVLARRAAGPSGTIHAPLSSTIDTGAGPAQGIALTRSGAGLQANALSAPLRVAYRAREGGIERLAWTAVDAAPRSQPDAVPVLSGARAFSLRYLNARGEWQANWGLPGSPEATSTTVSALPAAVEMTLELASGERIVRLIDLPGT